MSVQYIIDKGDCCPQDPYVWMMKRATEELPVYGTTCVGMKLDGIHFVEILKYDPSEDCWIWEDDWYEGQREIFFEWSAPIDQVRPAT